MEEEQYTEELTFKKIWEKIKLSGVRIIVYALIGLIIAAALLGVCNIIMTKSQYETRVTYYYTGVEDGNDPWGGQMSLVTNIRTSANVRNALAKCGYNEETIDALVNEVIRNLSVIPSTANEKKDDNEEVISADYNYRIVLAQSSAIDKHLNSKNEYNTIVNAITEEYINAFKANFSIDTKLSAIQVVAQDEKLNTLQNLGALRQYVQTFATESSSWQAKAGSFVSSSQKESFATLSAQIATLSMKLSAYEVFILQNALDSNGESGSITSNLSRYENEVESATASVSALQEAMKNNPTIIDPGLQGTVIIKDTSKLQEQLISAIAKLESAQNNLSTWQGYKSSYETNGDAFANKSEEEKTALYQTSIAKANEVINGYNTLLETYKGMIKDFNEGYSINSLVRVTSGAKQTNTSALSTMSFIIILVAVIILAVIIAMCVTSKKGALRIKALEKKKAQEEVVGEEIAEEVENQENTESKDNSEI